MEMSQAIDLFVEDCRRRPLADATIKRYSDELSRLPFGNLPPAIEALREALADSSYSRATRQGWYRTWNQFFKWLWDEHSIPTPMIRVRPPRSEKIVHLPFTEAEQQELFGACLQDKHRALLLFLLDTGARRGEVASLRRSGIYRDGEFWWATISGKTGPDQIPISELTARWLLKVSRGEAVWATRKGLPMTEDGINVMWRRLVKRSGIRRDQDNLPGGVRMPRGIHTMRRTAAKEHFRRGMDIRVIQQLLRHSKVETTQRYVYIANEELARIHRETTPVIALQGRLPLLDAACRCGDRATRALCPTGHEDGCHYPLNCREKGC